MLKWFSVLILAAVGLVLIVPQNRAHALEGVGQEILCVVPTDSIFALANDSNDLQSQGFTAPSTFTLGAIKLNLYDIDASALVRVFVTASSGASPNHAPDMNTVIGSEAVDIDTMPAFDSVVAANNAFTCDPDVRPAQVVIFDPPLNLTSGTTYSIVTEFDSGSATATTWAWPWFPNDDPYPNGNSHDCNVPSACARLTPATWDRINSQSIDLGFALFDNILTFTPPATSAEAWLDRLLGDLGLNDVNGKLLVTVIVSIFIAMVLVLTRIHPIIILGVLAMWAGTAVSVGLIPAWITLTMAAIFSMMLLYGIVVFRTGGAD